MVALALKKHKQCQKKKGYATEAKAIKAIDLNHGYNNPGFNVYECPHCFMWHVGHKINIGRFIQEDRNASE